MLAITFCICFLLKILLKILPAPTREQIAAREKEEKEQRKIESWGRIDPALVCPHCQSKGYIRTKYIRQKTGVSRGKATAVVLTGGLSLVVAVDIDKLRLCPECPAVFFVQHGAQHYCSTRYKNRVMLKRFRERKRQEKAKRKQVGKKAR